MRFMCPLTFPDGVFSGDSTRPLDRVLTQTNAPPPQSPQITRPPSQQPFLSEITFKRYFYQFMISKGVGFSDLDLIIDDRPIDLYALYTAVFSRGGIEAVRLHYFSYFKATAPTSIYARCLRTMSGPLSVQL